MAKNFASSVACSSVPSDARSVIFLIVIPNPVPIAFSIPSSVVKPILCSVVNMAYELLFSRLIDDDKRTLFTDVPIVADSVMIEITALSPDVRRLAGWIYPIIYSAPQEYERQEGSVIIFGRSRLKMPSIERDLFLEFFPQYGLRGFILSVYSGLPGGPPPPPPAIQIPNNGGWIYRSAFDGFLMHSQSQNGPFIQVAGWAPCQAAVVRSNGQIWLNLGDPSYRYAWSAYDSLLVANADNYNQVMSESGTAVIPSL